MTLSSFQLRAAFGDGQSTAGAYNTLPGNILRSKAHDPAHLTRGQRYAGRLEALLEQWHAAAEASLDHGRMQACLHKDFYEVLMKVYQSSNQAAVQKLIQRQAKQRMRAGRRATRRGETYKPASFRKGSESKAFDKWPEIAAEELFPAKLDWELQALLPDEPETVDADAEVIRFPTGPSDDSAAADAGK